jgi:hypothetical protein
MKIYMTNSKKFYQVEKNENETLKITCEDGTNFINAGNLIDSVGGVDKLLSMCVDFDGTLKEYVEKFKENEKAERAERIKKQALIDKENKEKAEAEYKKVFCNDVTESTIENIKTLLVYLNTINWGCWNLPKMAIPYSCNQYDCDGRMATTIILKEPVDGETKYVYGASPRHLSKYCRI